MNSQKEDFNYQNSRVNESSIQEIEEQSFQLNELFEAKNITAVTSKDQTLRLKIYPGARYDINTSIIQQQIAVTGQATTAVSTAATSAIHTTRKPKSNECLLGQQSTNFQGSLQNNIQAQESKIVSNEETINTINTNGTVPFKQIFPPQYSQESKIINGSEDFQIAHSSQDKSLLIPSILGSQTNQAGNSVSQHQNKQQGNINSNNSVNQQQQSINYHCTGSTSNPTYSFYSPSDFLIKEKWVNLIVDLKSFFGEISDDFVVKNIEIGSQCRLKSIIYSKQHDLTASILGKHEFFIQQGTNKFIPQIINCQQMSQMMDDSSPRNQQQIQRKSIQTNINFLLPSGGGGTSSAQIKDISVSNYESTSRVHNQIGNVPSKTPNKSGKHQSRYSVHLSNYKHSQAGLYEQSGSSKIYAKQAPPPLSHHQSPSSIIQSISGLNTNMSQQGSCSTHLSKMMKRRESKKGYTGNSNHYHNNHSFQQQQHHSQNNQQQSYLSNNVSFEQQPCSVINPNIQSNNPSNINNHSHSLNTQHNILYYQSTSQSTHPNCAQFSDEEGSKGLYSGSNTQRTSSVYFYNAKRGNSSNIAGFSQQSIHSNSQKHCQNSYLNNSISAIANNSNNLNASNSNNNNNNNSIRLPKIISLLKQRSNSIYSGVTNRSNQIMEELDVSGGIQSIRSTRRAQDTNKISNIQINQSPNNTSRDTHQINNNAQNCSCPHKSSHNNKIQTGLEMLISNNIENNPSSPNKNNSYSVRTNQKSYKSSQQRFVTMSINQSPSQKNQEGYPFSNYEVIPNNPSIQYQNANDLYNISDQGYSKLNEDKQNVDNIVKSEEDENPNEKLIKSENRKITLNQNKENDPRSRNTPAQKKEKKFNLSQKRRSSLFSAGSKNYQQLQQNSQTINSINSINGLGSLQTSRRNNCNKNQNQQIPQNIHYQTQQSTIQNEEDQMNTDYSQYAYYAPKNKRSKVSQSPSQLVSYRNGSTNPKKGGNVQNIPNSNNKNNQMSILNSPQSQQQQLQQQQSLEKQQNRNYIRNSYGVINKKSNINVQQKQYSVQIGDYSYLNGSDIQPVNQNATVLLQNDKKKKIIIQDISKDVDFINNTNSSQHQSKIASARVNYHQSPPPSIHRHIKDNSQEGVSHIQTKSKISLIPSHLLQNSLQSQVLQTNPSNSLSKASNINKSSNQQQQLQFGQGNSQVQQLTQANSLKKQLPHKQQGINQMNSKSNSRNQSPLAIKTNSNGKNTYQIFTVSNSGNNTGIIKLDQKPNSLDRNSTLKKSSPQNINSQAQQSSPLVKKNIQKSNFSHGQKIQSKQNSIIDIDIEQEQGEINQQNKKDQQSVIALNLSKPQQNSPTSKSTQEGLRQKINNGGGIIMKTEEVPDKKSSDYNGKTKIVQQNLLDEKTNKVEQEKLDFPKKNLLQAFNLAETIPQILQNQNVIQQNKEEGLNEPIKLENEQKQINNDENNEIYTKNFHRFSSSFNNPELCIPHALLQKNVQQDKKIINIQSNTNQEEQQQNNLNEINQKTKTHLQIGSLKNPIPLTSSNLHKIQANQQSAEQSVQQIIQNEKVKDKIQQNDNISEEKIYKRKYQQNSVYKKKSKEVIEQQKIPQDKILQSSSSENMDVSEEIIELQRSECITTNQNEQETIEEKIETKSISLTNQSKASQQENKLQERFLVTSGSIYQSEHMTSSEEECNESGLAVSIQVDNIDLNRDTNWQKPQSSRKKKKQASSNKKKETNFFKPNSQKLISQESGNKYLEDIEKQLSSLNSIEVSKVLIIQENENQQEDQLLNQIPNLPYTSEWRIQSFLIENKTDILKHRSNLNSLICGINVQSNIQNPINKNPDIINQDIKQNIKTQEK